ncbi:DUF2178 domain-containing protein [Bacillus mangrovi]|uniref:DUF2178 domain-containing protein n=1 Tax=Metabacillus mangrovi TaxID=1491830 RepID=A0A7X2S4R2_9BACI|nr:DUF2178 domain-containing protein [Metabacillus mangrovi]MTH53216.1 DUF2178 domain-containing protein [Metabacillus mangrovi]
MLNNMIALAGLSGGLLIAGVCYLFARRNARKKRGLDERYRYMMSNSKALSWNVTFFAILLAWVLVIAVEGISLSFFVMSAIYVIHSVSLIVFTFYFSGQHS